MEKDYKDKGNNKSQRRTKFRTGITRSTSIQAITKMGTKMREELGDVNKGTTKKYAKPHGYIKTTNLQGLLDLES